uniref:Adhesion G protein-coupled receptor L2-like isoform X2 n=1 Tax=Crassostrea virginica TaxID=6565 RepID=A0A8B8CV98_CRAVI|nr:adhesion G protein-coupled receptor L2-like isoform X2 [Crassostrea virginica]
MTTIGGFSRRWKSADPLVPCLVVIVIVVFVSHAVGETFNRIPDEYSDVILTEKCHPAYYTRPKCLNHTDGYGCACGPGFSWNTQMCMSSAIDSRLEFSAKDPVRYTLLLDKAFPKLSRFSIGFWIRLRKHENESVSTIMSYKHGRKGEVFRLFVNNSANHSLGFAVWRASFRTNIQLGHLEWSHVFWTWESKNGSWEILINNTKGAEGRDPALALPFPSDGEFVLGQSPREKLLFNTRDAFVGDIAHLNIWNKVLAPHTREAVYSSCIFMYCGNAVQWADLRSGTRGPVRMRWPSTVVSVVLKDDKPCNTIQEKSMTCNKYCSDVIGAQCNLETVENIVWARTPAITNATVPCPGQEERRARNETYASTSRTCYRTSENEGIWGKPYIDQCIAHDLLDMKKQSLSMVDSASVDVAWILTFASDLLNHTSTNVYTNPIDVATVIDLLGIIVKLQAKSISVDVQTSEKNLKEFKKATIESPTQEDMQKFIQVFLDILNNLMDFKHDAGWKKTKPRGVEGDNLLTVVEMFAATVADIIEDQMKRGLWEYTKNPTTEVRQHIEYKLEIQKKDKVREFMFPDASDSTKLGLSGDAGEVRVVPVIEDVLGNVSITSECVKISGFRFKHLAKYLPNHEGKSKEDNVNTAILALYIHNLNHEESFNLSSPIRFHASYLDTFNISNAKCVRIEHPRQNNTSVRQWQWTSEQCTLVSDTSQAGYCSCFVPGVFALTTDMYNVNWDRGIRRPILMNIASYAGCALTAFMCLASVIIHIRFRSSTTTASLHKHLAASVVLGQIVFMVGIDKYDNPTFCHIFAVLLHYAFMCNFCWLMNEVFNQYIVITYAAHSHSDQLADNGSMIRYYVLGWIFPGVLVGAFVGSQGESYYAKDMCWIAWDSIWLFVAPAVGLQAVCLSQKTSRMSIVNFSL